jgi:hypothetical protein
VIYGISDALFNLLGMTLKFEFWFPIVTPNGHECIGPTRRKP